MTELQTLRDTISILKEQKRDLEIKLTMTLFEMGERKGLVADGDASPEDKQQFIEDCTKLIYGPIN